MIAQIRSVKRNLGSKSSQAAKDNFGSAISNDLIGIFQRCCHASRNAVSTLSVSNSDTATCIDHKYGFKFSYSKLKWSHKQFFDLLEIDFLLKPFLKSKTVLEDRWPCSTGLISICYVGALKFDSC